MRKLLSILLLLPIGIISSAVYAQNNELVLEEVVVTATKKEENVQSIAQTVNAVTGADIDDYQINPFWIPEEFVTMESFWHHSIACGLAARSIAKHKQFSNPENLYVAGMLHDIGSLVIYKQIPEKALQALTRCNQWGVPLAQAEKEVFGFDHTLMGKLLIEQWKLPESWSEIAQFHHNPKNSKEYAEETAIVHLADHIAHNSRLGSAGHSGTKPLDESVWETLNIDPSIKSLVFREMIQLFNDTVEMFIE